MPRYDSYLIRVWRGDSKDDGRWAGRLEHLPHGPIHRFSSLEDLLTTLQQLLRAGTGADSDGEDPSAGEEPSAPA